LEGGGNVKGAQALISGEGEFWGLGKGRGLGAGKKV